MTTIKRKKAGESATKKLAKEVVKSSRKKTDTDEFEENKGNWETMVSTGSTLLDLAISGGRRFGGGIPGGIMVEIYGPSSSGKTVMLCEIAGAIQRQGGQLEFHDPEARLNPSFASMFDLKTDEIKLSRPNTVEEVINAVRNFNPEDTTKINGIMADSLAALSTEMEMTDGEDKMGGNRAKKLSAGFRTLCRYIAEKNILMVMSNQIREKMDAGKYEKKTTVPGGKATKFYCSLQLEYTNPKAIKKVKTIKGAKRERRVGDEVVIKVAKNSLDKGYREATVYLMYDYGIDDIRGNLSYLKTMYGKTKYYLGSMELGRSLDESVQMIEDQGLEAELREEVISVWEDEEAAFYPERKKKVRV